MILLFWQAGERTIAPPPYELYELENQRHLAIQREDAEITEFISLFITTLAKRL